jgi:transposase
MAKIEKKTKRYPSDLTDEEWERIAPLMPKPARRGRPREVDLREVINAVRYLVRSGCGWEMLPVHFGPWQTVYWWFRQLMRRFLFQTIHDLCLMCDRERIGREASPSAAVIDSQSVKAPHAKTRGYDASKKIVGRKRHIAVDTDGRLLMVNLTPPTSPTALAPRRSSMASASAGPGSSICSPMAPTTGCNSWTKPTFSTSSSRSSAEPMPNPASRSCRAVGSSSAASAG